MGLIVAGSRLWFCRWVEIDEIWLIWSLIFGFVQQVSVGCEVGFGLISVGVWLAVGCGWLVVGCGVGLGGWQWWFPFLVDSGGFGCGFFFLFCFTLLQTHNVEYFSEHFPRMQTNTGKTIIFPENHLHLQTFYGGECFTSKQTEPKKDGRKGSSFATSFQKKVIGFTLIMVAI